MKNFMLESSIFPVRPDPGLARLAGQNADSTTNSGANSAANSANNGRDAARPRPVFCLEPDPEGRIDGSIPVWTDRPSAADRVASDLTSAAQGAGAPPAGAQAWTEPGPDGTGAATASASPHPFGFGDLLDMINPLQHIPVVSNIYRYITGDTIQPVSQLIGDAAFGGPLGAAGALINIVVKDATGKDIAGNLMALAFNDDTPAIRQSADEITVAGNTDDLSKLPGTVIGFADLGNGAARASSTGAAEAASIAPAAGGVPPVRVAMSSETFSAFDIY